MANPAAQSPEYFSFIKIHLLHVGETAKTAQPESCAAVSVCCCSTIS